MAFDQKTRNLLQRTVTACRRIFDREFTAQLQELYGIQPDGYLTPSADLNHLSDEQLQVASLLRSRINHLEGGEPAEALTRTHTKPEHVARVIREQAFTVMNRLAALRLCEERGLVLGCVCQGVQSEGFQLFLTTAGSALGDTYEAYCVYLHCLFDELSLDLGVLFDRFSPLALLFPRKDALEEVLRELNGTGKAASGETVLADRFAEIWQADEAIGWIYQYYNDEAERKKMREESSAPRNSRELAVRNQFFTPRYVVEFLTDNTLGRFWYEMTRGETALRDACRYLVRRPTEIFLQYGELATVSAGSDVQTDSNSYQEDLLHQPVYIPHRPIKDPREIRLLDPACGSMHFGLYAFDLFSVIYEEAWELAQLTSGAAKFGEAFESFATFLSTFQDKSAFLLEVPRLIIEHNIHGIDIDPRAAQIAGLSLWLRGQRAWHQAGVPAAKRPRITRSNIVCAEPMPGEKRMLRDFVDEQFELNERAAFAFLLEKIFDRMTLAGEAGSLLKIEEEIRSAIQDASSLARRRPELRQVYLFPSEVRPEASQLELQGLVAEHFWKESEQRIYDALEAYAEQTEYDGGFQRRLFSDDAAEGFAFIDLCRKRYDVIVMNPPFGAPSLLSERYIRSVYPLAKNDIYGCFIQAALQRRAVGGLIGAITSRTWMFLPRRQDIRLGVIDAASRVHCLADLGHGVLDTAMVETCAFCLSEPEKSLPSTYIRLVDVPADSKELHLKSVLTGSSPERRFDVLQEKFKLLPGAPFAYWISTALLDVLATGARFADDWEIGPGLTTRDNDRFLRSPLEVPRFNLGSTWYWFAKGGSFSPYYFDTQLVLNYARDGEQIKAWITSLGESETTFIANQKFYFQPGFTYPRVTDKGFNVRVLRAGHIFAEKGISIFPKADDKTPFAALAFLNSSLVQELLLLMAPSRSWEKTFVASLPALRGDLQQLEVSATKIVQLLTKTLSQDTTSNLFSKMTVAPSLSEAFDLVRAAQEASSLIVRSEASTVSTAIRKEFRCLALTPDEFQSDPWEAAFLIRSATDFAALFVEYLLGTIFGRWDIRCTTGERISLDLADPFEPLPVCPPGMLQGSDGLPLLPEEGLQLRAEGGYHLDIAWDGILVEDSENSFDVERNLHAAFEVVWPNRSDVLEHEASGLLGVTTIREWFHRPLGFFADHLKRYSKSRRQAPIYWPLSSSTGRYILWLYYHRLTPDTLYKCLQQFVIPKMADVDREVAHLRTAMGGDGGGAKQGKRLEELEGLRRELSELRTELEFWAPKWKPNLNDGVLINAAPLWRLFHLPKWQKDLKVCWQELERGDHDWSHLAKTLWPDRVREKCRTDRSLAIAHNLEDVCEVKAPVKKAKKVKVAKTTNKQQELLKD